MTDQRGSRPARSRRARLWWTTTVVVVAAAAFVVSACGSSSGTTSSSTAASTASSSTSPSGGLAPGTLKIGMTAALSGFLPFDDQISNGMKLAVKEINAAGGIGGKVKLSLDIRDTHSDTATAVKLTQELIDGGAKVVVAECNADAQVAAAAVAQQAGVIELSACDAEPKIGTQYPNYWGIGLSPNVTMAALAQYAAKDKGYKTAYVLNSNDLLYNKNVQAYFKDAATKDGIKITGEDLFKVGATDFASQITKIKNLNPQPDFIFSSMFVPDSGTFIKQLRAAGVKTPFMSADGSDSQLLTKIGGTGAEGACVATHAFPVAGEPTATFYDTYAKEYGSPPNSAFAAVGFNTIQVLEAAITKAGSTDPKAIAATLSAGIDVGPPAALWQIKLPPKQHWPNYSVPIICVKNGAFARAANILPTYVPTVG